MSLTFASWNINSIRARAHLVRDWLDRHPECTLLALQEIKCEAHQFPKIFEEDGFHIAVSGQKAYNGVAFISREKLSITADTLPGFNDPAARYIETELNTIIIGNLYLPNGNSGGEKGLKTKLNFLSALYQRAQYLQREGRQFVFIGDYNVCPEDHDFASGTLSTTDALLRHEVRSSFRKLIWLGLTDAVRSLYPKKELYTFWDYQAGAFQRNAGLRIDHALLSPRIADRLENIVIDKDERAKERPSDHVPLIIQLSA